MNQDSFAGRFEAAWQQPTPEGLASLLTEDVVLIQPHLSPIRGKAAVIAEFTRLFAWLPGAHSIVKHAEESDAIAFIEHELRVPIGGGVIRLPAVDRFVLRDGLATERVVYLDQVRLILAILRHPSLWPGYIRYRFGR